MAKWSRTHLPMQETQETWVQSLGGEDPLEWRQDGGVERHEFTS